MSLPDLYPPAIHKLDGSGSGRWSGRGAWKLVIHTTESRGLPDYQSGALAPHLTYWPARRTFTQHVRFSRPAESVLAHDDDQILQLEIVAFSDERLAARYPDAVPVSALTADHLADVAGFVRWVQRSLPIRTRYPARLATSYAAANAAGFRFSVTEFLAYDGLLGHQHVPGNTHWDPGAFRWDLLVRAISGANIRAVWINTYKGHPFEYRPDDVGSRFAVNYWQIKFQALDPTYTFDPGTADSAFWIQCRRWGGRVDGIGPTEANRIESALMAARFAGTVRQELALEVETVEVVRSVTVK